ncbi:MAG: hypothetical protein LLF75_01370 [Eubacteriales bacterium]|nr:hypothetical protein [Eubacteriales bacterium]
MKRLLLVFAVLTLAALLPIHTLAAEENGSVTIVVGSVSAENGAFADVPVYLENSKSVDSIQFDLNYDPAALSIVSVTPGDLFLPEYVIYNADEPGRLRIACADALGLKGDGTLLTVRFTVLSGTGSALTATSGIITCVDADYNQTNAYVSLEDGGVSIGESAAPAALVTPWIPETPVPTPTPEPTPTVVPDLESLAEPTVSGQPESSAAPIAEEQVGPVSYIVVAVLFFLLLVLIFVSAAKRRRKAAESQPDHPARKDS